MAPTIIEGPISAKRAQFAGPDGIKGLISNRRTTAVAFFASLGGLVYGCTLFSLNNIGLVSAL